MRKTQSGVGTWERKNEECNEKNEWEKLQKFKYLKEIESGSKFDHSS